MRQALIIGLAVFFVLVVASAAMAEESAHQLLWGVALLAGAASLASIIVTAVFLIWLGVVKSLKKSLLPQTSRPKGLTRVTTFFIGNYSVLVEVVDGVWISPFKTKRGVEIRRESREDIIESLKGCLKKEEFATQKEELIWKSVIKELNK